MENIKFREITIEDIDELIKLDETLYNEGMQFTESLYMELINDKLSYKTAIVDKNNNIFGAIGIGMDYCGDDNYYVYFISIRKDMQRQGWGSKLLNMGLEGYIDKDVVLETDDNLIRFYEKSGFRKNGENFSGIIMTKFPTNSSSA